MGRKSEREYRVRIWAITQRQKKLNEYAVEARAEKKRPNENSKSVENVSIFVFFDILWAVLFGCSSSMLLPLSYLHSYMPRIYWHETSIVCTAATLQVYKIWVWHVSLRFHSSLSICLSLCRFFCEWAIFKSIFSSIVLLKLLSNGLSMSERETDEWNMQVSTMYIDILHCSKLNEFIFVVCFGFLVSLPVLSPHLLLMEHCKCSTW